MPTMAGGWPISLEMSWLISALRSSISLAALARIAPRSAGVVRDHGPSNAARAADTAASMSAGAAMGQLPTRSSVAGENTSSTWSVAGATHAPPM